MEFKKPKPKKNSSPRGQLQLPSKSGKIVTGIFNGNFVTVHDSDSMIYLYEAGNFGKGNLSKGEPRYRSQEDDIPKVILQHQFENQAKWNGSNSNFCPNKYLKPENKDFQLSLQSVNAFLQSSFGDNNIEMWKSWKGNQNLESQSTNKKNISQKMDFSYLEFKTDKADYEDESFKKITNEIINSKQIKRSSKSNCKNDEVVILSTSFNANSSDLCPADVDVRLERLSFPPSETLNLNLEESFFLKSEFGCLNIVDLNFLELSISELWEKFNAVKKNFMERYITYHYYRTKGWIIRSGLKFGGDFLLYKDGPTHYHASYLVKVLDRRAKLTWREFLAMNRLVETFNKDLLVINVLPIGTSEKKTYPDVLSSYSVQEILVKRWFPSKERISKSGETSS